MPPDQTADPLQHDRPVSHVLHAVVILLCVFGLWTSLHYVHSAWFINNDTGNIAILWNGYREHGWQFLKTFVYTQDNWLFSLLLPEALIFAPFGADPTFVIVSGWLIFLGCVAFSLSLAHRLGGYRAVLLLAPLYLLSSQEAMGVPGSYGEPVSHNVTMFWGLVALQGASSWLGRRSAPWLGLCAVALFMAAISDPWANAAFSLPMFLAALGLGLRPGRRSGGLALAAAVTAAALLAITKLAGVLSFLPETSLALATPAIVLSHLRLLASIVTMMFEIVPGYTSPPEIAAPGAGVTVLGCAVFLAVLAPSLVIWARALRRLRDAEQFVIVAAVLSMGATVTAFCLTTFATGLFAGRFLINVGFFVPVLGASAATRFGSRWPRIVPRLGVALAGLMMLTGATSNVRSWFKPSVRADIDRYQDLDRFLAANRLTYGYGSYWGSNASAQTWLSRGRVIMRPVAIDPASGQVTPWPWQSSPLWYTDQRRPPGDTATFLVLDHDCPQPQSCIAGLSAQFGPPAQILPMPDDRVVLVWPKPLPVGSAAKAPQ